MNVKTIKYIDEKEIRDKKVLLRVDFNVTITPQVTIADDARIRQSLPTIEYLLKNHNKIIIVSHLGRPKKREEKYSLRIVANHLQSLLPGNKITLVNDFLTLFGQKQLANQGEKEIMMLENIRFYPEEQSGDKLFAQKLGKLADIFVNDAFGVSHRPDTSVVGVVQYLPSYGGLLLKKEIGTISKLLKSPKRPFVAIVGGAKISTKINLLYRFIDITNYVLLGGGIANTFLAAKGYLMGKSLIEAQEVDNAKKIIEYAKTKGIELILPEDVIVGSDANQENGGQVARSINIPENQGVFDIGPDTLAKFGNIIAKAKTIVWNGPVGYVENKQFCRGTDFLFYAITHNSDCLSVVGGGDTLASISKKEYLGKITHISTGGGAMLEYIENSTLPGIDALSKVKTTKAAVNVYEQTRSEILAIGTKYNFDREKLTSFVLPDRVVEIKIPIRVNGKQRIFKGYRSQHNNKRGPYKGGIRFHKQVSKEEIKALSIWMSIKCAVANIPFGGGKGGITVDPKELGQKSLEALSRGYVRGMFDVIGPTKDIPAPDVNTNAKIMQWMSDEYIKIAKEKGISTVHAMASFTGKPTTFYGVEGRTEATGFGGVVILQELVKVMGLNPNNLTVAVQGFGNVGYYFSYFAQEKGFKIIAVADSKCGIYKNKNGNMQPLDIPLIMKCKEEKGILASCYCVDGVCDTKGGIQISNEEFLELPVDILVPAALESVITEDNMKNIKAKIIIEMANGPVTSRAYRYLTDKGVTIIPDILANAGGVTGSYIEWRQNMEEKKYTKVETLEMIAHIMRQAFANIWAVKQEKGNNFKEAAYYFALKELLVEN